VCWVEKYASGNWIKRCRTQLKLKILAVGEAAELTARSLYQVKDRYCRNLVDSW